MGRPPCCDKSNVKRGLWSAEEDAKILAHVSKHGTGNWTLVPKKAGLNRCGKSCRLRWTNYLRPDLNHDDFTPQEEDHIINLHQAIGSRWSLIAKQLPGRTDNDVKNYWNTKLRKKLYKMGIDPLTHKPFSQVLSEFGTISAFPGQPPPPSNDHPLQLLNQQQQPPQFFNEPASSSSSSSTSSIMSSSSTTTNTNWTEFLIQEPEDNNTEHHHHHHELLRGLFSSSSTKLNSCGSSDDLGSTVILENNNNSSLNSFVDTIMDQDSELMRSAFPEFLEESLEYY